MRIRWNGTGAAWSAIYGNSSAFVESGDHNLLIDCGHTVPARLSALGVALSDVGAIFISHLHGDHAYGLEEFGFRSRLVWRKKIPLLVPEAIVGPLWSQVLCGTMFNPSVGGNSLDDYFDVAVLHCGETHRIGSLKLEIRPVRHVPGAPAFGLKVTSGLASAAFTCDSLADEDPWFFDGSSMIFHDCSFNPYYPGTVHSHFEQLQEYPPEFRRRMHLVHYDDRIQERLVDPEWTAALDATGMRLAQPGLSLDISETGETLAP